MTKIWINKLINIYNRLRITSQPSYLMIYVLNSGGQIINFIVFIPVISEIRYTLCFPQPSVKWLLFLHRILRSLERSERLCAVAFWMGTLSAFSLPWVQMCSQQIHSELVLLKSKAWEWCSGKALTDGTAGKVSCSTLDGERKMFSHCTIGQDRQVNGILSCGDLNNTDFRHFSLALCSRWFWLTYCCQF